MAPTKRASTPYKPQGSKPTFWTKYVQGGFKELFLLATEPSRCYIIAILLFIAEIFVNILVIEKVKYTEIDWRAYMQEVEGVIVNGTTDYSLLRGDTGPLVYPAGFVWFYAALYKITSNGENVKLAQYIFAGIYLLVLALVFRLLCKSRKVPPYVLVLMSCTSYRIHSIFVLRLFNDPVCMLFLYAALNAFSDNRWSLGSLLYSLAVSVKMNILLFAPALFLTYLAVRGFWGTVKQLTICAFVQLALAYPFLSTYPVSYLKGAFDIGRVFMFKWTVNWRFLPEDIFVHPGLHIGLLCLHGILLLISMRPWWMLLKRYGTLQGMKKSPVASSQLFLLPMFMSNFIGLAVARSLHYQFYVWYYHQLPYLMWSTPFPVKVKLLLWGLIELAWNTYPSTFWSSGLLHACHLTLLVGLFCYLRKIARGVEKSLGDNQSERKTN